MLLTPDSANYISAAQNLLLSGDLNVNVNWPSWSYQLGTELYSEYPPGFPLIISFFLLLIGDPTIAIAVIQSFAICFLYFAVYKLSSELKFSQTFILLIGILLTIFPTFRVIYAHFWTESLFVAILIFSVFISLKLMKLSNRNLWIPMYFMLFFASGIKYIGIFNLALLIPVFMYYKNKGERLVNFFIAVFCSILPIGIWFLRNLASFGSISRSHFADIVPNELTHDITFVMFLSALLLISIYLIIIVTPLINKKIESKVSAQMLLAYMITFVSGMGILSILTRIDPPGHRLLSPLILIGIFSLFVSLKLITEYFVKAKFFRIIQYGIPILLIAVSLLIYKYPQAPSKISINKPVEELLWSGIKKQTFYNSASHFYSSYNFVHQIYAGKHQVIIWEDAYNDIHLQRKLINLGDSPFFIVDLNDSTKEYLDLIQSYETNGYKFKVYLNPIIPNFLVLYRDHEK